MAWFALMTTPQAEFKAEFSISRMGVNAQCPIVIERRIRQRRSATIKQEVCKALFPSYIFVELGYIPAWIFQEKHVVRPLTSPIPDDLMRNALEMSGEITVDEWREVQAFYRGNMVRHKQSGLVGKVDEVRGKKLIMLVELLGKIHRKTVTHEQVEAAE